MNRPPISMGVAGAFSVRGNESFGGRRELPLIAPLSHLAAAIIGMLFFGAFAGVALPAAFITPFNPHTLADVHMAVIGWITMSVLGASYQLTPVILAAPLVWSKFVRWQFPIYFIGAVTLIFGFWYMRPWYIVTGGSLIFLAVAHHVTVLIASIIKSPNKPLTAKFILTALIYLLFVISFGITAGLNLQYGFFGQWTNSFILTHLTIGIAGWLLTILTGVSYTLIPMFSLTHGHSQKLGEYVLIINTSGVVVFALSTVFAVPWFPYIGMLVLLAGLALYAYDVWQMYRKRLRKKLEPAQLHAIAGMAYLCVGFPFAMALIYRASYTPHLFIAAGVMIIVGAFGQHITGYMYKIVPFLVWHTRYGPDAGIKKVPLLKDLLDHRATITALILTNIGILIIVFGALFSSGAVVTAGSVVLELGFVVIGYVIFRVLSHLRLADIFST